MERGKKKDGKLEYETRRSLPSALARCRTEFLQLENLMKMECELKKETGDSDVKFEESNIEISPVKERQDYWNYEKKMISVKSKPDMFVNKPKPDTTNKKICQTARVEVWESLGSREN